MAPAPRADEQECRVRVIPPGMTGEDLARLDGTPKPEKRTAPVRPRPAPAAAAPEPAAPARRAGSRKAGTARAPKTSAPPATEPARRRGRPPKLAVGQFWRRGTQRAVITAIAAQYICLGRRKDGNLLTWTTRDELLSRWQREGS